MRPDNGMVTPLLTDLYQITMAYAYWKADKHEEEAVFELFFRTNPFKGEFTVFAGLDQVIAFLDSYRFSEDEIAYLGSLYPAWEKEFFDYLRRIDVSKIQLYSIPDGTVVFPRVPLLIVKGPLAICQLLETTLLVLVNYACLMTTNAVRHRLAAGEGKILLEFGLRRAQGPDGAMSA
jgi:nicotinate phosphoribosyltransferase